MAVRQHAIFIGYRRDDSADTAGRIYDRLEAKFGKDHVFKDVDSIPFGEDFGTYVSGVIKQCRIFLPLIGPRWLEARHQAGGRRLDDPADLVRIEIETAFATPGVRVVPVLLGGARMPAAEDLPPSLRKLANLNAAQVRPDPDFRFDMERLARDLAPVLRARREQAEARGGGWLVRVGAVAGLAVLAVGGFAAYRTFGASTGQQAAQVESIAGETPAVLSAAPIAVNAAPAPPAAPSAAPSAFREPEMVNIPGGTFTMGSPASEAGRYPDEAQHSVSIRAFAAGKYEVTFDEWDACVADGGCGGYRPKDEGWGRGRRPVINVSWNDAKKYVAWLKQKTGKPYRPLTEAEWEYAARARTTSAYWWGEAFDKSRVANGNKTEPVGSYAANPFGLYDTAGNVWEWVEDCDGTYAGAPSDGSARTTGDCSSRVLRGGSWVNDPRYLRSAGRDRVNPTYRSGNSGFRVARSAPGN